MKRVDVLNESWCQVWYDRGSKELYAKWVGYLTIDQVEEGCQVVSNYVRHNPLSIFCSNHLEMKVMTTEVQEFLSKSWLPELKNIGLDKMAVIMAKDSFAKASLEKALGAYSSNGGLSINVFKLEKEYLNWLNVGRSNIGATDTMLDKITAYHLLGVDEEVKKLDPLSMDESLETIREYNECKRAVALVELLRSKLPSPESIDLYDYYKALAAMRDIGILLGSIKRLGLEPVHQIPELEYVLEELGAKTELPARDTLLHYTVWNPDGDRMRTYTNYPDERALIRSVKYAFPALESSIDQLIRLHNLPLASYFFEQICEQTTRRFKKVVDAIVLAYREVSPEIFARELRFYFDPILVGKRELIGPGAVEMPMFVYDHLLWSSRIEEVDYVEFKETYLRYNVSFMQSIYDQYYQKDSLVDKAISVLNVESPTDQELKSAKALLKLCNVQKSFRKPHKKLADESYKHQEETGKSKGSGGYSTDILSYIYELNMSKLTQLEHMIIRHTKVSI